MSQVEMHVLKDMLEGSHMMKIFHDCRRAASALRYQQGIVISNVFDTQVATNLLYYGRKLQVISAASSSMPLW